ncbi:MAG: cobaltochelatase CobN [Candidatus Paceibacteria bacterium]|jgi:cobaltochelatase CobN|tara:strand:- start:15671 stop:19546 length:3876 start_codon:yes stop_codon:yes gene_type:complete
MHLLAAQPGGFVEEEGIIDLGQDPAKVVILAAADTSLAMLATAAEQLGEELPSIRLANWSHLLKPAAFDLYEHKVLEQAELVMVSLLGGASYWNYGFQRLQAWQQAKPNRHLILVPGDDAPDPELTLASSCEPASCQLVWQYLRQGGVSNGINLLRYLLQELNQNIPINKNPTSALQASQPQWQPPAELPQALIYQPGVAQASLMGWQKQTITQGVQHAPVVALLFYRSHLQSGNTRMFDGLMASLVEQGMNPIALAITSLKDPQALALVNHTLKQSNTKLVLSSLGFASNKVDAPSLSSAPTQFNLPIEGDIPVLQLVLSSTTNEAWREHKQGLRSRDIAMQVVLPEMDGHVLTRAISFKSMGYYSKLCQINLVGYELEPERAQFVARLAKGYCSLGHKANNDKRIALILANYPTKDGRIGNGVGLDTPQSAINVLQAMQDAGYAIDTVPENGNALIETLLESVTNNPNTLHHLPCWQSLDAAAYLEHFSQLPEACQQAVWQRWGSPEQDPKYRQGRIMLAGLRLGETFVGIQPARGYNLDLTANYHDPDLVPPHSYLAFYFWLRHVYQVDAVIHLGKHGNLEWLPGKGVALSDECWPDVALGPMPHFYPFIVNDPGEGAQAKRRAQGVIIDHLMPPMARAETYGELADLETLVDELYQAAGLDTGRELWLREQIVATLASSNVKQELGLTANTTENEMLAELDTYLCDIKEAQIRNGLHVLGQLPEDDELSETIVALLRLPRGEANEECGILHNLALDLGLKDYNPLATEVSPWLGAKPQLLAQQGDGVWRSSMDTRERLELLALSLVNEYLLSPKNNEIRILTTTLPRISQQLAYAKNTILVALEDSAVRETQALIQGLAGQAVEPGPSGAPTRGRLDTLPTGRNFFSLDNRSVPSAAAWALGQRSAQALIERHLQEHGDYPTQLGLSVWGTATMRTGGDDIAQAFALMGIKPIWAPGSQRVTDFEIIPAMQLGRPRVDVTLRVSGFFRDAFPNVMKLYDAAVQALATFDEPGSSANNGNTIRQNVEQRQAELEAQGVSAADAKRQASYRVYGSKPGAYGAGLQGLIDERCWAERVDLADAYLNWGGYAYGNQTGDGVAAHEDFKHRLSQLEVVVQNQDNREHDLLDSDDYYQFQGGMTNAVTSLSGQAPAVYHSDHSNPSVPKIRTLKEELNRVLRSRVLNPKWISAMQRHGYKGAFEMAASVDYLFAYDATTDLIADYQYQQVSDALIFEANNQQFMRDNNPAALEEMTERLLEACQRGMWQQPGAHQQALQDLLLDLDQQKESAS